MDKNYVFLQINMIVKCILMNESRRKVFINYLNKQKHTVIYELINLLYPLKNYNIWTSEFNEITYSIILSQIMKAVI